MLMFNESFRKQRFQEKTEKDKIKFINYDPEAPVHSRYKPREAFSTIIFDTRDRHILHTSHNRSHNTMQHPDHTDKRHNAVQKITSSIQIRRTNVTQQITKNNDT